MHLDRKAFPKYFVLQSLHKALPSITLYYKVCTKHVPVLLLVLQGLHKVFPSTSVYYKACTKHVQYYYLYYKACTKHFPVLLCTTKLAQSTSQYYFVQQRWHKARSCNTLYYKACTKHFPVLLCTTHAQAHPKQLEATVTVRQKKQGKPTAAAPAAHRRYLSSPPAATLHGKTRGFVLWLPPQNKAHATRSHYNAFCGITWLTRMYLHTWKH